MRQRFTLGRRGRYWFATARRAVPREVSASADGPARAQRRVRRLPVKVPGPERVVYRNVPGPIRTVPSPERVVTVVREVKVPVVHTVSVGELMGWPEGRPPK